MIVAPIAAVANGRCNAQAPIGAATDTKLLQRRSAARPEVADELTGGLAFYPLNEAVYDFPSSVRKSANLREF